MKTPEAETLEDIYELSPTQQGMLFHSLAAPGAGMYLVQEVYSLEGPLNISAFEGAWQQMIERHPILRTSFLWEDLEKPLQVVRRNIELPVALIDWRDLVPKEQEERLGALTREEGSRGFQLAEAPLVRVTLARLAEGSYRFLFTSHHLLLDGWSMSILFTELLGAYHATCRAESIQLERSRPYGDYIEWLQQQDLSEAEAFWRHELEGFSEPTPLPIRPASDELPREKKGHGRQQIRLSSEATMALRSVARQHALTMNTLLQGAWALLLSRYSGREDVVFGAVVSGRPPDLAGVESMVGLFINTLPVRVRVTRQARLLSWLKELQARQIEARQYGHTSLVDVHGWSDVPRRLPMFESILVFENYPSEGVSFSGWKTRVGLDVQTVSVVEHTNYPLTLCAYDGEHGLTVSMQYEADVFEAAITMRILSRFQTVLESMPGNLQQLLGKLPLSSVEEQKQLLTSWNDTMREFPQDQCIHRLFEAQVERTPNAIAVVFSEEEVTYEELNRRANRLAHHLRRLGVGPDVLVGILVERSLEMVVGLLGILKAGGAYVPVDPAYPRERIVFMLADAQVPVLLTQQRLVAELPRCGARAVCLDGDWELIEQESDENPVSGVTAQNLAYVIYTSGSTGAPKGVATEHRSGVNLSYWARDMYAPEDVGGVLAASSICFDCTMFELFCTLSWGGTAILAENILHLPALPRAAKVTLIGAAPTAMAELLRVGGVPDSVRVVNLSGEALQADLVQQLYERTSAQRAFNLYGASEATTYTTCTFIARRGSGPMPLGRPIANVQMYLLDANWQPVATGEPGEIYIGGAGLARGYLNRPELTAERFIPNPFSAEPGARLYKTGDMARCLPDGSVEFRGRLDNQVKVCGFRIELEEIETALRQHPAVEAALVVTREEMPADRRLVAYVVITDDGSLATSTELRGHLREKLPAFMMPAAIIALPALPLLANGKVDRRALPAPEEAGPDLGGRGVAPRDTMELQLRRIWEDILNTNPIGMTDNFFDLGGHSLLVLRLMTQIHQQFGRDLPLSSIVQGATIEHLACMLRQEADSRPWSSVVEIQPAGRKRPFFCVHPAGGNVLCYVDLARHLGPDQPFYGLQSAGLDGARAPYVRVEDMAVHYIEALQSIQRGGPYLVGGWSFGGLVACEMARQLMKRGQEVALLALFDTWVPDYDPTQPDDDHARLLTSFLVQLTPDSYGGLSVPYDALRRLSSDEQLDYVLQWARRANLVPPDAGALQISRLVSVYEANIRAMLSYTPRGYPKRITLFRASERATEGGPDPTLSWSEIAAGAEGLEIHMLPGSHRSIVREPHVRVLAEQLRACLEDAQTSEPESG